MFTGIINLQGIIENISIADNKDYYLTVCYEDISQVDIGASIAHNGVCLTVIKQENNLLSYQISQESINCTTIANWKIGDILNVERSLRFGDELGGHLLLGHVDGISEILAIEPLAQSHKITFKMPKSLAAAIASKGSIAIDGVSLTINQLSDKTDSFSVNIVPHTFANTIFRNYKIGSKVNLEIDVIARYIARNLEISKQ